MKTFLLVMTLLMTGGAVAAAPDPPARADWMRRPCPLEDSVNCFWNAGQQGDGGGHSFYTHRFPGGSVCVMYVAPAYARRHDECLRPRSGTTRP